MDRFAIDQRDDTVAPPFFVPGGDDEVVYASLRAAVGSVDGCSPRDKRIFRLTCRLQGRDCAIEVGLPDPVSGRTVLAIFDVGGEDRYVVRTDAAGDGLRLGRHVYGVTPFA